MFRGADAHEVDPGGIKDLVRGGHEYKRWRREQRGDDRGERGDPEPFFARYFIAPEISKQCGSQHKKGIGGGQRMEVEEDTGEGESRQKTAAIGESQGCQGNGQSGISVRDRRRAIRRLRARRRGF